MSAPVDPAPRPPLPYRARPPQVLLGVGAVLLVSAGAAVGVGLRRLARPACCCSPWRSRRAGSRSGPPGPGCAAPRRHWRPARPGWRSPPATRAASRSTATRCRPPSSPRSSWCCTGSRRPRPPGRWRLVGRGPARGPAGPGRGAADAADRRPPGRRPRRAGHRPGRTAGRRAGGPGDVGAVVAGGVVGGSTSAWADDGAERWLSAALVIAAAFGAARWRGCARSSSRCSVRRRSSRSSPGVRGGRGDHRRVLVAGHRSR